MMIPMYIQPVQNHHMLFERVLAKVMHSSRNALTIRPQLLDNSPKSLALLN